MNEESKDSEPFWRIQYRLLHDALHQEANRFWTRFQMSLLINGGLLVAFYTLFQVKGDIKAEIVLSMDLWTLPIISIIGIVITSIWIAICINGYHWTEYYIKKGTELEKDNSEIKTRIFGDLLIYERAYPIGRYVLGIPVVFLIGWIAFLFLGGYDTYSWVITKFL